MIVKIKKPSRKTVKNVLSKITERKTNGFNPKKYFGKLVRGLDGVAYQKAIRNEWDLSDCGYKSLDQSGRRKPGADHYLYENKLFVSVITEIELLGWYKITNGRNNFLVTY